MVDQAFQEDQWEIEEELDFQEDQWEIEEELAFQEDQWEIEEELVFQQDQWEIEEDLVLAEKILEEVDLIEVIMEIIMVVDMKVGDTMEMVVVHYGMDIMAFHQVIITTHIGILAIILNQYMLINLLL